MDGEAFLPAARAWSGEQVRLTTAGSVDDGKSSLIGRLLLDAKALMRDQAASLDGDDGLDLASLTDGLEAERAQGITIDVAYRYFATPRTSFIIADAPGHEQYTRNMVTAASVSDVAVIVIDVTGVGNGVLKAQTRRHAAIAALMGLNVIVAVNKMDLVGWSEARFDEVRVAFGDVAAVLGLKQVVFVPVSALRGDNVVRRSPHWSAGPTLIEALEGAGRGAPLVSAPLRLPIQAVLRHGQRRFYAGRIESGALRPGDQVRVGPGALLTAVASVRIGASAAPFAETGASVAVELAGERDLARGDVIADAGVRYTSRIAANLCWLDETQWAPGKRYLLRQGTLETQALIEDVAFVRDMNTLALAEAERLQLNDIAGVTIAARDPLLADPYAERPGTGSFVLFDPDTNRTCAAGMILKALA